MTNSFLSFAWEGSTPSGTRRKIVASIAVCVCGDTEPDFFVSVTADCDAAGCVLCAYAGVAC